MTIAKSFTVLSWSVKLSILWYSFKVNVFLRLCGRRVKWGLKFIVTPIKKRITRTLMTDLQEKDSRSQDNGRKKVQHDKLTVKVVKCDENVPLEVSTSAFENITKVEEDVSDVEDMDVIIFGTLANNEVIDRAKKEPIPKGTYLPSKSVPRGRARHPKTSKKADKTWSNLFNENKVQPHKESEESKSIEIPSQPSHEQQSLPESVFSYSDAESPSPNNFLLSEEVEELYSKEINNEEREKTPHQSGEQAIPSVQKEKDAFHDNENTFTEDVNDAEYDEERIRQYYIGQIDILFPLQPKKYEQYTLKQIKQEYDRLNTLRVRQEGIDSIKDYAATVDKVLVLINGILGSPLENSKVDTLFSSIMEKRPHLAESLWKTYFAKKGGSQNPLFELLTLVVVSAFTGIAQNKLLPLIAKLVGLPVGEPESKKEKKQPAYNNGPQQRAKVSKPQAFSNVPSSYYVPSQYPPEGYSPIHQPYYGPSAPFYTSPSQNFSTQNPMQNFPHQPTSQSIPMDAQTGPQPFYVTSPYYTSQPMSVPRTFQAFRGPKINPSQVNASYTSASQVNAPQYPYNTSSQVVPPMQNPPLYREEPKSLSREEFNGQPVSKGDDGETKQSSTEANNFSNHTAQNIRKKKVIRPVE